MSEQITFCIQATGEVSVSVEGVTGSGCDDITRPFEEMIGSVCKKDYTDRYYENSQDEELQTQEEPSP
jgi:hypothetical protein